MWLKRSWTEERAAAAQSAKDVGANGGSPSGALLLLPQPVFCRSQRESATCSLPTDILGGTFRPEVGYIQAQYMHPLGTFGPTNRVHSGTLGHIRVHSGTFGHSRRVAGLLRGPGKPCLRMLGSVRVGYIRRSHLSLYKTKKGVRCFSWGTPAGAASF